MSERPTVSGTELARVRRALAGARGHQRVHALLSAEDPAAVVAALPADELWFTIREAGLSDAVEIVQLATPEQYRIFLDLECWKGGELSPRRALPLLRAARAGAAASDEDGERWREKLSAVDLELLDLVLMDGLVVHDLDQDPDPHIESDRFMRTPEGRFVLEFTVSGAEYAAVRGVVDDLYAEDPFRATRLLLAIRWELRSELEETALRWRTARLADLGYPSLDEALAWFARPGAAPAGPVGLPERPAGFFLEPLATGSVLAAAARGLDAGARERLEQEMVAAANAVMVADAVEPEDLEAVRRAMESARALVELGLEALATGIEPGQVLATTPVKRLFQHGHARLLALHDRAAKLLARPGVGPGRAPVLDAPLGEALAALARRRPRYHPGLALSQDEWGGAAAAALEPRPFLSRDDLVRATGAVEHAEALVRLGADLGLLSAAERPERIRLGALLLTATANARLGRPFAPSPLPLRELPAALAALDRAPVSVDAGGPAAALLTRLARARAEELAPLRGGDVPMPQAESVAALWLRDA